MILLFGSISFQVSSLLEDKTGTLRLNFSSFLALIYINFLFDFSLY